MKVLIINCSPVRNGATAEIVRLLSERLCLRYKTKVVCIDDYQFSFCKGCRSCHKTAECIQHDDVNVLMDEFSLADIIISVSPSYWHNPHKTIPSGKKGYAVALRTGPGMKECERIISSIEHFYGHLEIECCGHLGLCSVEYKEALKDRMDEIEAFCKLI